MKIGSVFVCGVKYLLFLLLYMFSLVFIYP